MKEELENIDDLFKDELKDYSPKLPEGAWDNIAIQLASQSSPRKVIPLFWKVAASVAVLISTGLLGIYLLNNKPQLDIAAMDNTAPVQKLEPLIKPVSNLSNQNIISSDNKRENVLAYSDDLESSNETESIAALSSTDNTEQTAELSSASLENESLSSNLVDNTTENTIPSDNLQASDNSFIEQENNIVPDLKEIPEQNTQNFIWQTEEDAINNTKSNGQWYIGGQGGPQYTYRTVSPSHDAARSNPADISVNSSNIEESGTIAYAAGIHVEYKPVRKFSIQSGVYYSKYSINSTASVSFANNDPAKTWDGGTYTVPSTDVVVRFPNSSVSVVSRSNNSFDAQTVNSFSNASVDNESIRLNTSDIDNSPESSNNYEYIEIPVIARYALIDKKFNLQVLGGLSTNILIKNYTNVDLPSEYNVEFETERANTLNYSSTFGIGLGYDISKRITMSVEPQFKYFLGSQVYDANNVRPYSLGVYSGVKYRF